MKILFAGNFIRGSLTVYRAQSMAAHEGLEVSLVPATIDEPRFIPEILRAVAWKLRVPFDEMRLNERVLECARELEPDVFYCESVLFLRPKTLRALKSKGIRIVGMSQDYVTARHNSNRWQDRALRYYDLFFTTKSFGIEELKRAGVADVRLVNNTYVSTVHRPLRAEEVGPEYEAFDCVFVGTFERDRALSLRRLADSGLTVLIHGNAAGRLSGGWSELAHPNITLRPAANDTDYTLAIHRGKVALAFLRKLNRDEITTRSIEIPAMGRAMLAERTAEHSEHFEEGQEYVAFEGDDELVRQAHILVADKDKRESVGRAGMLRCQRSHYDNDALVRRMVSVMRDKFSGGRST